MSPKSVWLSEELHQYVMAGSTSPNAVASELIATTEALGGIARMQIAPEQGAFMAMLTAMVAPKLAVEIGTFTGYSALMTAGALPPGGRLLCCDVSEEWTAIAREHWERAGVADRIDLRIAPALDTLTSLPADTVIDLVFIDADKTNYANYYNAILPMLAPDGLILVDNVLWHGDVVNPANQEADTVALREFTAMVAADDRVDQVIVPIGDGVTMIRRSS